jgi:hypothetical protein
MLFVLNSHELSDCSVHGYFISAIFLFSKQKSKELPQLVTHALHLRCKNNEIENSLTGAANYKSGQRVCSAVYKKKETTDLRFQSTRI